MIYHPTFRSRAYTLVQLLMPVAVLAAVLFVGIPAHRYAQAKAAIMLAADAQAKRINDAIALARKAGDEETKEGGNSAGVLEGNDSNAAISYLTNKGYFSVLDNG